MRPGLAAVGELDRIDAPDIAVAVGHAGAIEDRAAAARIGLARIERHRRRLRAELVERQVQHLRLRAVGGGRPAAAAGIGRTVDGGLADMGNRGRADGLRAGLGIEGLHHVLRHRLLGPQPLAVDAIDRLDDAELAGGHQRLAGLAVDRQIDQDALVDVVEIPGVVLQILMVPLQLAGIRIDGERGVRIERVVLDALLLRQRAAHLGDPRIGLAGAEIDGVQVGIVAAGHPGRGAEAALERQAVPGRFVGVARMRDGPHPPQLLAGVHVVAGDEAAAGLGIAAAGHALDQLAVGDQRAAGIAPALGPVAGGVIPHHLAGRRVERHDMGVGGRHEQLVLIDRHVALAERLAAFGHQLLRQSPGILPDQVAGRAIDRLHLVGIVEDVEHAVMHDRRGLGGARRERPGPGHLQILDVVLVDLVERAVAPAVIGAPPHQPVGRIGLEQHRIGHRLEVRHRGVLRGEIHDLLRAGRRGGRGDERGSEQPDVQRSSGHRLLPVLDLCGRARQVGGRTLLHANLPARRVNRHRMAPRSSL